MTPFYSGHTMWASKYATMIHSQGSLNFLTCFLGLEVWWLEFVVKLLICHLLTLHTYWLVGINRPWSLRIFFFFFCVIDLKKWSTQTYAPFENLQHCIHITWLHLENSLSGLCHEILEGVIFHHFYILKIANVLLLPSKTLMMCHKGFRDVSEWINRVLWKTIN